MRKLVLLTAACVIAGLSAVPPAGAHQQLHRGCTNSLMGQYYVGVGHVNCRFAVRSARRMINGGGKPAGWRCRVFAGRLFGTCTSQGRIFSWAGAE